MVYKNLLILLIILTFSNTSNNIRLSETIRKVYEKLKNEQEKISKPFNLIPFHWASQKGMYKSHVHFNFNEKVIGTELRRKIAVPDLNVFVTIFVQTILAEIQEMEIIEIDKEDFYNGILSILSFQDKNFEEDSPIYRFWPIKKNDNGTYISYPPNIKALLKYFKGLDLIEFICKILLMKTCSEDIKHELQIIQKWLVAFHIPPDIDDASVNLGLVSLLNKLKKDFPKSSSLFLSKNKKYDQLINRIKKYAYTPFSKNTDYSKIDPRTYEYLHPFLEIQKEIGETDIKLPTTWLMNIEEVRKVFPEEGMPFNVNNVDANVLSNFLFGMTFFMLYNQEESKKYFDDIELRKMYLDSAKFIDWGIKSNRVIKRNDIGLTYYPTVFDIFWFISRTDYLLRNWKNDYPFSEMKEVEEILKNTTIFLTDIIIKLSKNDEKYYYWNDFLGNGEKDKPLYEDRLFSTSLALNSLIDCYTEEIDSPKKRKWVKNTPEYLKSIIKKGIDFLNDNILDKNALVYNAFFSGSAKSMGTLPFFYAGNHYEYLNKTYIKEWPPEDPNKLTTDLIISMDGFVQKEEFKKWHDLKFFGMKIPTENTGFNSVFPFWSSNAMTYITSIYAFCKYSIIE